MTTQKWRIRYPLLAAKRGRTGEERDTNGETIAVCMVAFFCEGTTDQP